MATDNVPLPYEVLAIMLAFRHVQTSLREGLQGLDLQPGQELLLLAIGEEEHDQLELVKRLHVGQPTVSRGVSRLEAKGILVKTKKDDDGRVTLVRLTPQGRKLLPQIRQAWEETNSSLLSQLSSSEVETLVELLSKVKGSSTDD